MAWAGEERQDRVEVKRVGLGLKAAPEVGLDVAHRAPAEGDGAGGVAYGDSTTDTVDMGSAGGAAGAADADAGGPGGHGAGSVIIEAATIEIAGILRLNGDDGANYGNDGSGGGAGGGVVLLADTLTCTGTISAIGGDGEQVDDSGGGGDDTGGDDTGEAPPSECNENIIISAIQSRYSDDRARHALRPFAGKYPVAVPKWTSNAGSIRSGTRVMV